MRGIKELDTEAIVTFLVGKGFDRDVLNLCSRAWLIEILERQIVPEIPEDKEEPEDDLTGEPEDKAALRRGLQKAVKEFLDSGRSITHCPARKVNRDGESGLKWAKERWPDD